MMADALLAQSAMDRLQPRYVHTSEFSRGLDMILDAHEARRRHLGQR